MEYFISRTYTIIKRKTILYYYYPRIYTDRYRCAINQTNRDVFVYKFKHETIKNHLERAISDIVIASQYQKELNIKHAEFSNDCKYLDKYFATGKQTANDLEIGNFSVRKV